MGVHGGRKNRDSGERKAALRNEGEEKTIGTTKEDRKIAEKGKASSSRQKWRKPATGPRRRTRGARGGRGSAPGARGGGMERQQVAAEEVPVKRRPAAAEGPRTAPRGDGGGAGAGGGPSGPRPGQPRAAPARRLRILRLRGERVDAPQTPHSPERRRADDASPTAGQAAGTSHFVTGWAAAPLRAGTAPPALRAGTASGPRRGERGGAAPGGPDPRPPHLHPGRSTCPWTAAGRS